MVHAKSDLQIYHGVIAATADGEEAEVNKFCVTFNPDWFTTVYTNNVQDALKYPLYRIHLVINGCDEVTDNLTNTSVVIIDTGECSVVDRAKNLVDAGAELIVIARTDGVLNVTDVHQSNFSSAPIVLINSNSYQTIKALGSSQDLSISFYSPVTKFDGMVIAIYVICVFCIVVGSYWYGVFIPKI